MSRFASLSGLLAPRSVAIVGASADPARIGGRPIAYMLRRGFAGPIYPVNPNRQEVQGLRAYPDIASLPHAPDAAILALPAAQAPAALEALGRRGTRAAVVFSAGFAETGPAGAALEQSLLETARTYGVRMLGPNCLGLFNDRLGWYGIFSSAPESGWPPPGRIGIASQSGAFGSHLFAAARNRGIGTPTLVTTGNEADVSLGEVIFWLAEDPDTDVIAACCEGIRDAPTLLAALAAAREARKPVVMMKVGRSRLGADAARSHTASLAGDDAVTDAVLGEFAVVRAQSAEALIDIAHTATRRIYPVPNTLGVITISGGAGVLISDAAADLGLAMPEMPGAAQAALLDLLPYAAPRNPVDCTAQALNDIALAGRFMQALVGDGGYASVLAFFTQIGGNPALAPKLRAELQAVRARHPDRLYVLSVLAAPPLVAAYEQDGFVVLEDPTRAVAAIHAMGVFGAAFARAPGAAPPAVPVLDLPASAPNEAAAKALLARAGLPAVAERLCTSAEDAAAAAEALGWPVVLKLASPDIAHKSDIGGVLLDVADPAGVRGGYATLLARGAAAAPAARIDGVLVARQMRGAVECILGIQRDPVFGLVALFGLGGVFAEILDDVVLHRCPFGTDVAEAMIRAIRGAPLLLGARGRAPVDIAALADMLARLSVFAAQAGPRLRGIDLNPVLALPDGAFVADAVIEVAG